MIFGGHHVGSEDLMVELYNWKTGEQQQLGPLPHPIHDIASTVMDGIPMYCGGSNNSYGQTLQCFKFETLTRTWTQVS
jgi:hypothetical protein